MAELQVPEGAFKVVGDEPHHYFASSKDCFSTGLDMEDLITRMKLEGKDFILWLVPMPLHSDYKLELYAPQVLGARSLSEWIVDYNAEGATDISKRVWSNVPR